uniref:C2H2-type domain-containing protein n=1 Tax=Poecilia formosa TaxID=48698 RepID=A0A096MAT7_POEFO
MNQREKRLEADFNPKVLLYSIDVQQMLVMKEDAPEEHSRSFELEGPKPLMPAISKEDEECLLFSALHQHQKKDGEFPEDHCGAAGSSRNQGHGDYSNSSETGVPEDKVNHQGFEELKHLPDSRPKAKDRRDDWKGSHSSRGSSVSVDKAKCFTANRNRDSMRKGQVKMTFRSGHSGKTCDRNLKPKGHKQTNSEPKQFCCKLCGHTLGYKRNLTSHMRIHTGEKPFSCDICSKMFSKKNNLTSHMRIHNGEKPFSCDVCSKMFSHKHHLTLHMRIHNGEKPFSCEVCSKMFSHKHYLTSHMTIHTGEKPFSCDVCSQMFSQKNNLALHKRIHTGEKLFSCDFCSKMFSKKNNLTSHMRIHTGEKPFSCDVCSKVFSH